MRTLTALMLTTAAITLPQLASAADMPLKARPLPTCGAQFGGGYVGVNAGAVASTAVRHDQEGAFVDNSEASLTKIGGTIGVQAGYDWQSCNRLFGVAADWNWSDTRATTLNNQNGGDNISTTTRMHWYNTARVRGGLVVDNALFYATFGFAGARISSSYTDINTLVPTTQSFSRYRTGLVLGAGTEVLLGGNWTLNAEVLYMNFRRATDNAVGAGGAQFPFEANDHAYVARTGLNYRFGGYPSTARPVAYTNGPARFNGAYVGFNGASLSYSAVRNDQDGFFVDNSQVTATKLGWSGGAQAGYDWQSGARLFGVVGDINYSGARATTRIEPNNPTRDIYASGKLGWYGTLRGRLGLVADGALIYATAGAAVANINTTVRDSIEAVPLFSQTSTRWGWVGGVGTESALWSGWSVTSELLYMQFNKNNFTFANGGALFAFENNDSVWVSRIGLNYRGNAFGAPGKPYTGPMRFAGLYLGGNVGAASYTALRHDQDGFTTDNGEYTATKIGLTGGLQAGYDWQFGTRVFGVVGDINWASLSTATGINPINDPGQQASGKLNWYSTLRTRSGVAVDDVLVYVTGGLAVGSIAAGFADPPVAFESTHTRWGWTSGFGAEYAFAPNWSVTGEALYLQFKPRNDNFANGGANVGLESNDSAWVSRLGVNYRFAGR